MGTVINFVAHSEQVFIDFLKLRDYLFKVRTLDDRAAECGGQGERVAQHLDPVRDDGDFIVQVFVDEEREHDPGPVDDEEYDDHREYGDVQLRWTIGRIELVNRHGSKEPEGFRMDFVKVAETQHWDAHGAQLWDNGYVCEIGDVLWMVTTEKEL